MLLAPFVTLALPVLDLADPPPIQVPPMPAGASRIELSSGLGVVSDMGWEFDLAVVGAGYLLAWPDRSVEPRGTLWTRTSATYYTVNGAEMVDDRFWLGPFVRADLGSEIMGRYGFSPGSLIRVGTDLGFRFETTPLMSGAIGLGYGVIRDFQQPRTYYGMKVQLDLTIR